MSVLSLEVGNKYENVILNVYAMVTVQGDHSSVMYGHNFRRDTLWDATVTKVEPILPVQRSGDAKKKVTWELVSKDGTKLVAHHYEPNGLQRLFQSILPAQVTQGRRSTDEGQPCKSSDVKTWNINPEDDGVVLTSAWGDRIKTKRFTSLVPVTTVFSEEDSKPSLSCMGVLTQEGSCVFIRKPLVT